jgi:hypothetical protein
MDGPRSIQITVLSPQAGEILVCGGPFYPSRRNRLAGASLQGQFFQTCGINVGFCMELEDEVGPS